MVLELLNTKATPHIITRCYPTSSTNKWSKNNFIDPEDNALWDEQDLSPIEKGNVYFWKEDSESWIHIFMPFKIMDLQTAQLIKGFKTYRSTKPFVTGKALASDRFSKSPKSCLQNFRFTKEFFSLFKARVKALNGLLEKDEVNLDLLVSNIKRSLSVSKELSNSISIYRDFYCTTSSIKLETEEKKNKALKDFSKVREGISSLLVEKQLIVKDLDRLSKEVNRKTSYIEASEWFNTLSKEIESLRNISFDRFEREIIHKHRVDTGYLENSSRPPTLMSLEKELDNLKRYYPSLQKVKSSDEDIKIELPGLSITFLSDGSTKVVGDPGVLKPYIEGSTVTQVRGRRKRSIHAKGEK
ncbi:MAG: hypothetical protein CL582_22410 [Alteromonadaceae bacterium]|nr:hypothetical protein [Alteromonadaceae bacterium]